MTRFAKRIGASLLAASLVAIEGLTLAGSASAGGNQPRRHPGFDRHPGYSRHYEQSRYDHRRHGGIYRDRASNGRAIALGVGALILGAIIASEAERHQRDHD
jgi:hypothetical protein